jgi:tetratricopeptide (TPR) repeat protein
LLAIICTAAVAYAGDSSPVSPQTTFFHANALYKDGQYEAAAKEYEQVLHAGLASGNLYFNLGNAYFKAGEKGKAILNYERARRFIPGDPDVEANLAYAQSLTGAEACVPALWQRLVFPLAHRAATGRLAWIASVLYTLALIALTTYRLWPRRPRWLVYAAAVLAVLVVVASSSLARQALAEDWQHRVVVVASGETAARFEPAQNGTVHFALKEGTVIRVTDVRDGWRQVSRCDGRRGWVEMEAVEDL